MVPSVLLLLTLMVPPPGCSVFVWNDNQNSPPDCTALHVKNWTLPSGLYNVFPSFDPCIPLKVFCDMDSHKGGWMVIQRRMDGSLNFYLPWASYKDGFGNAAGEYWLGLENMYRLTYSNEYELLVEMEDFYENKRFALYSTFKVGPESDGYRLTVKYKSGDVADALSLHNGQKFSTFDKDQDSQTRGSCARQHLGGFWYNFCLWANPNGVYCAGRCTNNNRNGVTWERWRSESLKNFSMKIRKTHRLYQPE